MRISSLQNSSAITGAASYSGAVGNLDASEDTEDQAATATRSSGDKVTLSAEGLRRSKSTGAAGPGAAAGAEESGSNDPSAAFDKIIAKLKEKIEELKAEIAEIQQSGLPPELKELKLAAKQRELAMYEAQLVNALIEKEKIDKQAGRNNPNSVFYSSEDHQAA